MIQIYVARILTVQISSVALCVPVIQGMIIMVTRGQLPTGILELILLQPTVFIQMNA